MPSLLDALNPEQRAAVTTTSGPLLVLAGAGTGKTRVVTTRIAYLLAAAGVPARHVLAVTFTNKAAREMRERLVPLVGRDAAGQLTVGTFHAVCARLLREHAAAAGLSPAFSIVDASDQLSAVRGALRELSVGDAALAPAAALAQLSLLKNRMLAPAQALEAAEDDRQLLLAKVYERYEQHLQRSRALDFDDLLLRAQRLLAGDEAVLAACRDRWHHVLVDEYQDTNAPQFEIVRLLAGPRRNLCVVGDDDQSIYGWRGADVGKILAFGEHFPGAAVVRLETNYRSTAPILAAANRVIAHNAARHGKTLRAATPGGETPLVLRCDDELAEAEAVVGEIELRLRRGQLVPGDVAILFRTQQQPRPFEARLRQARIPYVLVGGPSFFDRKEVRDVLAWVRLLANPDDEPSWLRVVNRPPRGIGASSLDKVLEHAAARRIPARAAALAAAQEGLLPPAAARGIGEIDAALARLGGRDDARDLVARLGTLLDAVDYKAEVARCYPDEATRRERWSGVLEVLDLAENYLSRASRPTLSDFLERLTLATGDDPTAEQAERRGALTLMTLHGSKGLEFPEVYLVGVEEGLLPHARSVDEDTVEEERRLMYVGITRARRRLTLSWAASRSRHGQRAEGFPSRFLFEMRGEAPPDDWRAARPRRRDDDLPDGPDAREGKLAARARAGRARERAAGDGAARAEPASGGRPHTGRKSGVQAAKPAARRGSRSPRGRSAGS